MKKFWMLLLTALMVLSLCACQKKAEEPAPETPAPSETAEQSEETGFRTAQVVQTGSGVTVKTAQDWAAEYPEIYASYMANEENTEVHDYTKDYPMIPIIYEGMAFSKFYGSARGHVYTVEDVTSTGRPHALANCFSCKTPDFTAMVNELGDAAYQIPFEDALKEINEPISCYNCHANTGDELVVTHTYLSDAMGADLDKVDARTLSCGQCHVEYYFAPGTKATTLPYQNLDTMTPDAILDYYNRTIVDGQPFADYTNPRTGVRQIKVQHPEFETYMGAGSVHADTFTCADCHMGEATAADGTTYISHTWISPLENDALMENTCAQCHTDLKGQVRAIQEETERRTYAVGYELEALTEKLVDAIESGNYTEEELDAIRAVARDAQFYWDFVFVENSEGAHNSALDKDCLNKAEALANQAMGMFKR
ncbi:ammonia-forming cytochrome c nitrite reductase subunit c552 [Oscillibacter sp.]|uniref:ammonia-forming cytochrome c nitrite reductase subunit c552 n=1 Tax=Oscillibacter sp. TaxID=1945593 RepID=UPI001B3D3A0E|nr:ammonia-forming cytochrome c nitrite reductase subunit c552 [Oscillibacter sp.]MBP3510015.1 ammonia-forming cytochrome c nitrite reductase subunit c552 [Oscillibacter sp.]